MVGGVGPTVALGPELAGRVLGVVVVIDVTVVIGADLKARGESRVPLPDTLPWNFAVDGEQIRMCTHLHSM